MDTRPRIRKSFLYALAGHALFLAGIAAWAMRNHAPEAEADVFGVGASALGFSDQSVLNNDHDPDEEDSMVALLVSPPKHGKLLLSDDGHFTFAPSDSFGGKDEFTYRASDGRRHSAPTKVTLTLVPEAVSTPVAILPEPVSAEEDLTWVEPSILAEAHSDPTVITRKEPLPFLEDRDPSDDPESDLVLPVRPLAEVAPPPPEKPAEAEVTPVPEKPEPIPAPPKVVKSVPAPPKPEPKPKAEPPKIVKIAPAPKPNPKPKAEPKPLPKPAPKPIAKKKPETKPAPKPPAKRTVTRSAPKKVVRTKPAPKKPKPKVVKNTPKPAPKPTPKPAPKPKPKPKPKAVAKTPIDKPAPKPTPVKAAPKPDPKAVTSWNKAKGDAPKAKPASGGSGRAPKATAASGSPRAQAVSADFGWYDRLIQNAFHGRWSQPKNISSRLLNTRTRITIAPDGRVVDAQIVTRSGVSEMDASVERALRAVGRLQPIPRGLGAGNYSVIIRFELKPNAYEF